MTSGHVRSTGLGARRAVVVRSLRPDDRDRLGAFYSRLSPGSRHSRFFTEHVPARAAESACERVAGAPGAPCLVAVDPDDADVIVAEAITAWSGPAAAEVALAVSDDRQHSGLGSAMLLALAGPAARAGITTLLAEVLADSRAMLRVLRSYHAVAVSPQHLPVLTLAIAPDGGVPDWPPGPGRRVLVEGGSWLTLSGQEARDLADEGCFLVSCPANRAGAGPREDCPVLHARTCPLRAAADAVLCRFPGEPPASMGPHPPSPSRCAGPTPIAGPRSAPVPTGPVLTATARESR